MHTVAVVYVVVAGAFAAHQPLGTQLTAASAKPTPTAGTSIHHTSTSHIASQIAKTHAVTTTQPPSPAQTTSGSPAAVATTTKPAPQASPAVAAANSPAAPKPAATPVTTPATAPVSDIASNTLCPGQNNIASMPTVLVCMTSYARTQHGLSPVSGNAALQSAASAKVDDIIACGFSHTACGRPFNYWFSVKGYTGNCSAENIAQGQATPLDVFTAWMNSSGHRANILNPSYHDIGVAVKGGTAGNSWVMELGGC